MTTPEPLGPRCMAAAPEPLARCMTVGPEPLEADA